MGLDPCYHTCSRCESRAETHQPVPLCREHAIEFYTGLVAIGAATSRCARIAPGNVQSIEHYKIDWTKKPKVCMHCAQIFYGSKKRKVCPLCRSRIMKEVRARYKAKMSLRVVPAA